MNKAIRIICCMITFAILLSVMRMQAEASINSDEQRVIDVANATHEYNGHKYVATNDAKSQLYSYLDQSDIDLTSEQADAAINKFYSNITRGIAEGYLVIAPENNPSNPVQPAEPSTEEPVTIVDKDNNIVVVDPEELASEDESKKTKVDSASIFPDQSKNSDGIIDIVTIDNNEINSKAPDEIQEESVESTQPDSVPESVLETTPKRSTVLTTESTKLLMIAGAVIVALAIAVPVYIYIRKHQGKRKGE